MSQIVASGYLFWITVRLQKRRHARFASNHRRRLGWPRLKREQSRVCCQYPSRVLIKNMETGADASGFCQVLTMASGLSVNVMQTVSLMGMMTVLWTQGFATKLRARKFSGTGVDTTAMITRLRLYIRYFKNWSHWFGKVSEIASRLWWTPGCQMLLCSVLCHALWGGNGFWRLLGISTAHWTPKPQRTLCPRKSVIKQRIYSENTQGQQELGHENHEQPFL